VQCSTLRGNTIAVGILEVDPHGLQLYIRSNIFLYGNSISEEVRFNMEEEINTLWNEPRALLWFQYQPYLINFAVKVFLFPDLKPQNILANTNPRNNYIRVEETARGNISYVDGLGSNTGYFKLDNLYRFSTTSAHEYGHLIGLPHPEDLDIRGKGIPGIMYPRGTLVDAEFQYKPEVQAGQPGGTLAPAHRRVQQSDLDDLNLGNYLLSGQTIIGKPSAVYHSVELPPQ
jgi:hypothetical protein